MTYAVVLTFQDDLMPRIGEHLDRRACSLACSMANLAGLHNDRVFSWERDNVLSFRAFVTIIPAGMVLRSRYPRLPFRKHGLFQTG